MPEFYLISVEEDVESCKEEKLTNNETFIGRSFLSFKCNDQRISRSHGVLIKTEEHLTLKAMHTNPIFFKVKDSNEIQTLHQGNTRILHHDDQFGLLADSFWYRISVRNENGLRVKTLSELSRIPIMNPAPPQVEEEIPEISTTSNIVPADPQPQSSSSIDVACVVPVKRIKAEIASSQDIDSSEPTQKRQKTDDAADEPQCEDNVHGEATPAPEVPTNNAPTASNDPGPSSTCGANSTSSTLPTEVKKEVKSEEPDSSVYRDSCEFGVRCYRRNIEHRRELAHPGDTDYRRPNYPPAPADALPCPYAASCYRRNPQHFIEFSHPDSTQRIVPAQINNPPAQWRLPPPNNDDEESNEEGQLEEAEEEEENHDFSPDTDSDFAPGGMSTTDDELDDGEVNEE